jgi:cation diffusion facilitator CzcD-associated flavoprotein CzcO
VIGTGASSIQIVPEIAERVAHLDVYQRTAPWVMPRHDRDYTRLEKLAFRYLPGVQRAYRTGIYWARECFVPAFTWQPKLAAPAKRAALKNIERGISDPELREKVTPDFQIGCKRILISNTYYPTLARDDVELVTDAITEVTPTGIVTADGTHREIDALVVATGFFTTDQPIAHHIKGRGGRTLADAWEGTGMVAYKGTTINGFPNLFQLVGPNTGLGHSSMVFVIESQIAYLLSALEKMGEGGIRTVEPRAEKVRSWSDDLQRRMRRTVWNTGGCASWYLDEHGNNTILWPRTTFTFRKLLAEFDTDAYVLDQTAATTLTKEHVA